MLHVLHAGVHTGVLSLYIVCIHIDVCAYIFFIGHFFVCLYLGSYMNICEIKYVVIEECV